MRQLREDELTQVVGGEYSQSECAGLGLATGIAVCIGGPMGWVTAAFTVWQAAEGGCFR